MKNEFQIDKMPIFWREVSEITHIDGIPSVMDLKITGPRDWGGLSISITQDLIDTLDKIYREDENIGYLQDDNPLADIYAPEYINFIERHIPAGLHICEIGAGGCYSLMKLKSIGYKVSAIDPSPITLNIGKKHGINVIPEFFPSTNDKVLKDVDACIHYDVLEHIEHPRDFLNSIYDYLPFGGKTVFVVPDSTSHIENIDLSMCMHQHLNYFSDISLENLVTDIGFKMIELHRSDKTGTIYCCAEKIPLTGEYSSINPLLKKNVEIQTKLFFDNVDLFYDKTVNGIKELFKKNGGQKLAFYPPLRAIPYLAPLIEDYSENIVFVDDNTKVHGRYICDLEFPIMSRTEAFNSGAVSFLVCSKPFRETMTSNLKSMKNSESIEINYLDDFAKKI